jgi:cation diffusion facilitator CzcD-associated flavoprotein CzcO
VFKYAPLGTRDRYPRHDNHYPGLAVDIPALWYQLSFPPNAGWSRLFAPGPERYRYLQDTARRLGLYEYLQANAEVLQQKWDDTVGCWRLQVRDHGDVTARFLISSVGGYVNAKVTVDIDGIEDFEGTVLRPTHGTTAMTPAASGSR